MTDDLIARFPAYTPQFRDLRSLAIGALWYGDVIAEEMGVDSPPGEAVCPLRDWLRELKGVRAGRTVPSHFAIKGRYGNWWFAHLDLSIGPTACVWGPFSKVHVFSTEGEAREVMKICPADAALVPIAVEAVPARPRPGAANDSEGGDHD